MICNQCGAEFDNSLLQCPYCHSENRKEAGRQKNLILEGYDKEAENIRREAEKYPEKAARKWTGYLLLGICIALAVGVVLTILYLLCSSLFTRLEYAGENAVLAKLEEYYQAEDYAALSEYMREERLYGNTYEKYGEVKAVYELLAEMERAVCEMEQVNTYTGFSREEMWECVEYWAEDYISSAQKAMTLADGYINDRVFWDNEKVIQTLYGEVVEKLSSMGFSEEEIDRIGTEDTENLLDLKEKLFDILVP